MEYKAKLDDFILGRKLGSGFSCKVREGVNESGRYAIKYIIQDPKNPKVKKLHDFATNEYEAMSKMDHPNIVKLHAFNDKGIIVKANGKKVPVAYLAFDLITGGELFDYVAVSCAFSEKLARHYFKQLIEALDYIHNKGFCHRDIKAENLLMDSDYNLKLTDFGFAKPLCGSNGTGMLRSFNGSVFYMAPEILAGRPYIGEKVDFFSAGVLLLIMVTQHPPFRAANMNDGRYKTFCIQNELFWHKINLGRSAGGLTTEFRSLINELLSMNPAMRPSISEIKSHPWYNGETMTKEEIQEEFLARRAKVEVDWKTKAEAALAKKLAKKSKVPIVHSGGNTRSVISPPIREDHKRLLPEYKVILSYNSQLDMNKQ